MDRRTLLFFISVTFTLFAVNLYFQWDQDEKTREWTTQQLVKNKQKESKLSAEISERTAKADALPLTVLYADSAHKDLFSTGILDGDNILTLTPDTISPASLFTKDSEYTLKKAFAAESGFAVYSKKGTQTPLLIDLIPDFGKFDLQLVYVFPKNSQKTFEIQLGEYSDGQFTVPQDRLDKIKHALNPDEPLPAEHTGDAIVLKKVREGYLPVALYHRSNDVITYLEDMHDLKDLTVKPETKTTKPSAQVTQEQYYVLENHYQQLVFSNRGAALVEINLPFQTKSNPESVVLPIEFDREMVEHHPYNAYFPAQPYFTPGSDPKGSFEQHNQGILGGYYPLLRRDLIETGKRKSIPVSSRYYALNILSEYPELAELLYEVKQFDATKIVFEAVQSNRTITKTYSIAQESQGGPYCIDLTIQIEGDSRGLWLSSGVPEVEWISGAPAPALKYRITRNKKADVENVDLPKESLTVTSIYPDWICNSNGFLGLIIDPLTEIDPGYRTQIVSGTQMPSRLVEIGQDYDRFKPQDLPGYMVLLPLKTGGGTMEFRIFAGPFADGILKTVDRTYANEETGYNPDYIACQTFHGWFSFISEPFAKILFVLMNFFHSVTGSWAFSIVLLTITLRLMLYPLNAWSSKSMIKMQQIGPEVTAIQEKFKKDPKKAQVEIMNLYRDKGVNPVSGCLPLLIQMPFLIGMFDLLKSTFELRGASFIPGWIDNLTSPDVLFSWKMPIFLIGNEFHLLPIILGAVMFAQQRLTSKLPEDPAQWTDQQRQQRSMGSIMAVVFAVMFYNFPSGLNIYWLSSMLLGMLQQWWTQKQLNKPNVTVQCKPGKNS